MEAFLLIIIILLIVGNGYVVEPRKDLGNGVYLFPPNLEEMNTFLAEQQLRIVSIHAHKTKSGGLATQFRVVTAPR